MTHPFKFGDRVCHKEHGESVVVWTTDDTADQWVEVAYQNGKTEAYPNTDLELIPHPDTVRLDWLLDKGAVSVGAAYTEDGDEIEGCVSIREHIYISDSEILGIGKTERQAIDAAMQIDKEQKEQTK